MTTKEKLIVLICTMTEEQAEAVLPVVQLVKKQKTEKPKEESKKEPKKEPKPFHEIVYCIKHNKTGKEYIGRSGCYLRRIKEHMALLKKGKHTIEDMQSDYDKYGEDYTITILDEITGGSYWETSREFELMYEHESYIRGKGYNYKDRCFPRWKREYKDGVKNEQQRKIG